MAGCCCLGRLGDLFSCPGEVAGLSGESPPVLLRTRLTPSRLILLRLALSSNPTPAQICFPRSRSTPVFSALVQHLNCSAHIHPLDLFRTRSTLLPTFSLNSTLASAPAQLHPFSALAQPLLSPISLTQPLPPSFKSIISPHRSTLELLLTHSPLDLLRARSAPQPLSPLPRTLHHLTS